VLTQISLYWFRLLQDVVPHHVLPADVSQYDASLVSHRTLLAGRSMIVRKTRPLPVECVVRGYLAGSGLKDYRAAGAVCGIPLPPGLREAERLPEPIFTPATKAASGHDENIPFAEVERRVGAARAAELRAVSLALYRRAQAHLEPRGLLLADTKFEFGLDGDRLVWIDEALTPDSSRLWPRAGYAPGGPQPSYDKQFVRDYLEGLDWDKRPPGPPLPPAVVARTQEKYREALRAITGEDPA